MEKTTGNKIKLGAFVSAAILLFIGAIYFIGQRQQLFRRTIQISGIFTDVIGLEVGNNVRFSGINIGIVNEIAQVSDSTVKVEMSIEKRSGKFLKKNAIAIIGSEGLMGNKNVQIVQVGAGPPLEDGDILETVQSVSMDDILERLKVTTENAAAITDDLALITGNIRDGRGTIGKLLMDSTYADDVGEALVNIKEAAGGFKQNMDAVSHNFLLKGFFKKKQDEIDAAKKASEAANDKKSGEKEKKKQKDIKNGE